MAGAYAANGKTVMRWCDRCGTLVLGDVCSCGSHARAFEANSPGDVRPAMGDAGKLVRSLFIEAFGTAAPLERKAVFLNKVPGEDRADEVIAHGAVIAVIRFDVESGGYALDLRQAGAELFAPCAESNVVSFSGMSGHLKGKSLPGSCIREVSGSFPVGAPVILRKGGKIGAGTALASSDSLRDAEKAVRIRDLADPSGTPVSPDSGRRRFVEANRRQEKEQAAKAAASQAQPQPAPRKEESAERSIHDIISDTSKDFDDIDLTDILKMLNNR